MLNFLPCLEEGAQKVLDLRFSHLYVINMPMLRDQSFNTGKGVWLQFFFFFFGGGD